MEELYTTVTRVYPKQEDAVQFGNDLVDEGYMFMWEWEYHKGKITVITWHNSELEEMAQKIDMHDNPGSKKSKKLADKEKRRLKRAKLEEKDKKDIV